MKWRNTILSETATLLSGNVVAQGITLLAYLILTRIFSPEDYGLFNIFFAPVELLIILSTCKLELAVVAAKDDDEGSAVARLALRNNAMVSVALLVVIGGLCLFNALPGRYGALGTLSLLIPPLVFFSGTSRIYAGWFNRNRKYRHIAISETVNSMVGVVSKIFVGIAQNGGPLGLPLGTVLGQMFGNLNYRIRLHREKWPLKPYDRREVWQRFINYPRFVATKDFVNTFSSNLPFLLVAMPLMVASGLSVSDADVGFFALAITFTFRPASIVSGTMERVLFARSVQRMNEKTTLWPMLRKTMLILNIIALPVCVALFFLSEQVFSLFFGGRWASCGPYVATVIPWIYISLNTASLMFVPNLFSTQKGDFVFSITLFALRLVALAVGMKKGDFMFAIMLYSAVSAVVALIQLGWYVCQVIAYDKKLNKNVTA